MLQMSKAIPSALNQTMHQLTAHKGEKKEQDAYLLSSFYYTNCTCATLKKNHIWIYFQNNTVFIMNNTVIIVFDVHNMFVSVHFRHFAGICKRIPSGIKSLPYLNAG